MYRLSRVIQAHKRDARCLDYYNGMLVTGGNDKTFNLYTYKNGNSTLLTSSDIFDSEVLSIKINRFESSSHFVALGCRNGKIYVFDQEGNPSLQFTHDSCVSSLDFIDADHIVSGSWDGKAIVWSLSQHKLITEYKDHKYAVSVFYNKISNHVISASQDKALNVWDWKTGEKIKRQENSHNDIIRQIADVEGTGMIITCSNDEKLKLWSADLDLIQTFTGHSAFVFSVKALKLGKYISGGEDKVIKVWGQACALQDIQLPCSIWSLAFDENEDIFAAGSDGIVRTFTTSQQRRAEQDVEEMMNQQILQSSSKKSGMTQQEIQKLPTTHQMAAVKAQKEGEIRVFRNGMVPEAYMWQGGSWVKIGDVITEGGPEGMKRQPKFYPGDKYFDAGQYDYIFDVDDESGTPKVIPFNDGSNPMEAAERYCRREGLTKGYIEQIRKFLIQNSNKIARSGVKKASNELNVGQLKQTPSTSLIEYNGIKNPAALFNKLKQFNEKAEDKKLTEKELAYLQRIVLQLQHQSSYHNWKLDFKEMDALKKLLTWPKSLKFPAWDILRAFLKHYQSQSLFSGLESGGEIITQLAIGLETEYSEAIYTLILKTLSNILIQNTNKGGMIKHAEIIFQSLVEISKREELKGQNYLSAFAGFMYNFSIALIEKNIEKKELLSNFGDILRRRLELDSNGDNRSLLLQAGANILYKYHQTLKDKYKFVMNFLQADDVSADLKVFF